MPRAADLIPTAPLAARLRASRPVALAAAGLGIAAILTGCAADSAGSGSDTGSDSGSDAAVDEGADTSAAYADGEYQAEGSYESPNGTETIGVDLTLEGDTVTAVTVTPQATGGNSAKFQGQFASGISDEVVGEDIDTLSVSRVAGSSLTSGGFMDALEKIKSDAAS